MIDATAFVHRLAHAENVTIGARTQVWQFASVIRRAVIGVDCKIGSSAIVDGARIGDRGLIGHGASINPGITIGADVFIGPNVTLCNDFWPRVGKDGWCDIEELLSGAKVVTIVDDGASIGANAVILPGVRIGKGVMIGAGAAVDRNIPDHHVFRRDRSLEKIALDLQVNIKRMRLVA